MIKKIIEPLIVTLLIIAIFYLGYSNKLKLLINPSYFIFIYITLVVLFLIFTAIILIPGSRSKNNYFSYLLFLIMIIILFSTSYKDYQESISELKGVTNNIFEYKTKVDIFDGDRVVITEFNYLDAVDEIYRNIDKYIGKKILFKGYVYYANGIKPNEFVLSRLIMVCCAADTSVYGLLCSYENINHDFKSDEWYEINGEISKKTLDIDGELNVHPIINIIEYREIPIPEDPYIYPVLF
ncbi:MAG: TIGR03943 family protein [Spirochaetales bacterium]|nr:TIGR03943 family protein [Spirochaetales bacterium]